MRILLFDLWAGGHNHMYVRRFAEALADHDIYVAAPDPVLDRLDRLPVGHIRLGRQGRQAPAFGRPEESWSESIRDEIGLIGKLCADIRPDHFVHLFADHLVPHWTRTLTTCNASLLILFPSQHYPATFGSSLTETEWQRVALLEEGIARCRGLSSVTALMTLDPFAAELWATAPGAPVYWLPEPPVAGSPIEHTLPRSTDVIFFGALSRRKGLSRLTHAIRQRALHISVLVAGWVEQQGYEPEIGFEVETMRRAGAEVNVALHFHSEQDARAVLARSTCAVLPYLRHFGMSRVLLESCSVGTPVITHDFGLLGYLTRVHQLGMTVDCDDPDALAFAIEELTKPHRAHSYAERCIEFAAGFSEGKFRETVRAAMRMERADPRARQETSSALAT